MTTMVEEKNVLHVMDNTGDTKVSWDPDAPAEVQAAAAVFDQLKRQGYLAYTVRRGGKRGDVIREFDASAGHIVMTPQLVGG